MMLHLLSYGLNILQLGEVLIGRPFILENMEVKGFRVASSFTYLFS